jgi:Family of unknown function (DUF5941)
VTGLQIYRDDGPLLEWIAEKIPPRAKPHPLAWLMPPLVRTLEYGLLITLTAFSDADAMPFCFALLCVLAFHHYDVVYRLRHQRLAPPPWVGAIGGGWEGRLLVAGVLALAGVLGPGLLVAAIALGLVYATESTLSWVRFGSAGRQVSQEGDDGLEDAE